MNPVAARALTNEWSFLLMDYQRSITIGLPYDDAVRSTREALAEQGFGILTEIDVQATMRDKRGLDIEPYLILGACNPDLAHQALQLDRSIGVLLPCNVVVSSVPGGSRVQILDPQIIPAVTGLPALQPVADDASTRLEAVLDSLESR